MDSLYIISFLLGIVSVCYGSPPDILETQTVYGFLDFTTTIANTVMIFSPQSAPPLEKKVLDLPLNMIKTQPINNTQHDLDKVIKPTKIATEKLISSENKTADVTIGDSKVIKIENTIQNAEYNLLSRQPLQFAEETFHLVDLKKKSLTSSKHRSINFTKKTADLLERTHSFGHLNKKSNFVPIQQSSTVQHLATQIATNFGKNHSVSLQTIPQQRFVQSTQLKSTVTSKPFQRQTNTSNKKLSNNTVKQVTPDVTNTNKTVTRRKAKRKHKGSRESHVQSSIHERKPLKSKIQPSSSEINVSTSLYKFKLNRTPGRWQYKSSPKPRINIRKNASSTPQNNSSENNLAFTDLVETNQMPDNSSKYYGPLEQSDLEQSASQKGVSNINQVVNKSFLSETLNVEISTPADFKDTYYEIATIKAPFTFQAGALKKTRFITVTSTFEKYLTKTEENFIGKDEEPLTENILETKSTKSYSALDGSITTLMTVHINNSKETPKLETITESYNIIQKKLKTHILPVIQNFDNHTSSYQLTLVQTYDITSIITATKTTFSDNFFPSMNFKDIEGNLEEAGSEINLELEFGDESNLENIDAETVNFIKDTSLFQDRLQDNNSSLNKKNFQQQDLHPLKPKEIKPSIVTTSIPIVTLETIWESHIIPLVKGTSTVFRTLSKSVGVRDKTIYKVDTSTASLISMESLLPLNPLNPFLLPIQQPLQTFTSLITHSTLATLTSSKVLKLTFGAKTAYTTIYSTEIVPTTFTALFTTSVPIQQTASYPGLYPQAYPPFAYIG